MSTSDFAPVIRQLGLAAALICVLLSLTVVSVLLVVAHEPVGQAALHAWPLMFFAVCGAFGAAMTRLVGRRPR